MPPNRRYSSSSTGVSRPRIKPYSQEAYRKSLYELFSDSFFSTKNKSTQTWFFDKSTQTTPPTSPAAFRKPTKKEYVDKPTQTRVPQESQATQTREPQESRSTTSSMVGLIDELVNISRRSPTLYSPPPTPPRPRTRTTSRTTRSPTLSSPRLYSPTPSSPTPSSPTPSPRPRKSVAVSKFTQEF